MENLIFEYFKWHYLEKSKYYFLIWKNLLSFLWSYFSILHLLKTLFTPWHAYREEYGSLLDFKKNIEAFIINNFARFLGFVVRSVVIIVGLTSELAVLISGIIFFIIWFALPFIMTFILIFSLRQLFL
ncbi:hypothetical protein HRbin34_00376 [bacterium HR34]|nr:hypothetical protein HRbin34_00376 [bacterium HR34]